jgi:hypothetical protein
VGRFAPKLSDEMRKAIRAAAAEGRSAREIVDLASAGRLGGLRSFTVSESTVREIAGDARRMHGIAASAHNASPAADPTGHSPLNAPERTAPIDAIATRAQAILEQEMTRLEQKSKHGLKTQDATALKRLLQVAREVKAMQLGFVARGPRATRLLDEHGQPQRGNGDELRSPILDRIRESESAAQD